MKRWLLILSVVISTIVPYQQLSAKESQSLEEAIANTMPFSELPVEIQALIESFDLDHNDQLEEQLSFEEKRYCGGRSIYAFNFMSMRQKGYDYDDIYQLIDLSKDSDDLELADNSIDFYQDLLSEVYSYPVYETEYLKDLAIAMYHNNKDYQCLLGLKNKP